MTFHVFYFDADRVLKETTIEADNRNAAVLAFHGKAPGRRQIVRMSDPWGTFEGLADG